MVQVQAEGIHIPLQCFLEPGRAQGFLASLLAQFVTEALAPPCLDVVRLQRERLRALARIGLRRGDHALDGQAGPGDVAKALIDARQAVIGLDVVRAQLP